ncbi:restriction endonuclease subunit S [Gluconobacter japonicus]|uniref:restriction endonuclease subunit S n=1 Tax=Gluconobacter japonicus TaxID=376620 RepID=UPI001B8B60A4|nr:restriction endonuclease subunit S [Gluconobacter japonicus]MBS1049742.1 restriction endonuclease subunit S [Gluconobacter japonicus]
MLPEGWRKEKLGVVAEFQRGFDLPQSQRSEGSVPIISSSGVSGFHDTSKALAPGIVTGRYGSIGDVFYVEEAYWPLNTALWVKDFHGNYPKYLYYLLSNFDFSKFSDKTGVPGINRNDLHAVNVLVPPLPEQKKIAAILSTWDRAIEGTEKLLANSQQQKKALMQQLLTGKKRLPGFTGEWKTRTLGEIGEISSAGVDKKIVDGEEPIRLLNFTDVFKRTFIYSDDLHQWVTAPSVKVQKCNVKKGDVFFTPSSETRNDIAFSAVSAENMQGCCYSYHVVRLRFKEEWDDAFKAFIFSTMNFRRQVYKLADGSGQRYVISQDDFRSIEVTYPSLDEQCQIGAILRTAENEITALESDLARLRQEKKALMQQLLTGKRRVRVD